MIPPCEQASTSGIQCSSNYIISVTIIVASQNSSAAKAQVTTSTDAAQSD